MRQPLGVIRSLMSKLWEGKFISFCLLFTFLFYPISYIPQHVFSSSFLMFLVFISFIALDIFQFLLFSVSIYHFLLYPNPIHMLEFVEMSEKSWKLLLPFNDLLCSHKCFGQLRFVFPWKSLVPRFCRNIIYDNRNSLLFLIMTTKLLFQKFGNLHPCLSTQMKRM